MEMQGFLRGVVQPPAICQLFDTETSPRGPHRPRVGGGGCGMARPSPGDPGGRRGSGECIATAAMTGALGEVVYWFAFLRNEVDAGIEKMPGLPAARAAVLTVQTPFPDRVSTMAALVRQLVEEGRKFNAGDADPNEVCGELATQCLMAHRLRDQVMDSSWGRLGPDQLLRSRGRVHAASGLRRTTEATDAARLMDIADFITIVGTDVRDFFRSVP